MMSLVCLFDTQISGRPMPPGAQHHLMVNVWVSTIREIQHQAIGGDFRLVFVKRRAENSPHALAWDPRASVCGRVVTIKSASPLPPPRELLPVL